MYGANNVKLSVNSIGGKYTKMVSQTNATKFQHLMWVKHNIIWTISPI